MLSDDAAGPRSGQHERVEDTRTPVDQLAHRLDILREINGSAFDKIPPEGRLRVVEVGEINVWQLVQEGQLPAKERQAECACESLKPVLTSPTRPTRRTRVSRGSREREGPWRAPAVVRVGDVSLLRRVHDVTLVPRDHLETAGGHGRSRQ